METAKVSGAELLKSGLTRLSRHVDVVLPCLVGIMIIFAIDTLLVQGIHKEVNDRERLKAERLETRIQSALEAHATALIALKGIYENMEDITPADFQLFSQTITATAPPPVHYPSGSRLPGFRRLLFIKPNLTISRIYPDSPENKGLENYNLAQNPQMAAALKTVRNSQTAATSRLIAFLSQPKSCWVFVPVYRITNYQKNTKAFFGYAAGEIIPERIWQQNHLGTGLSQYQVQVIDPSGVRLQDGLNFQPGPDVFDFDLILLGQHWQMLMRPVDPPLESMWLQRGSLWGAGLLILALWFMITRGTKQHKAQMEEARKQFESIFEASPDGLLLLDKNLNLLVFNPVILKWLGKTKEELKNKAFFDLFACQCPNLSKCGELDHLLCASQSFVADLPDVLETRIIDPPSEDTPKTLRLNASEITQERNGRREAGFICVLGDISTSKELDRVKETYVATLTHDLKTPLLAQQMVLDTLVSGSTGPVNEEQKRLLTGAKESVQDLLDMVSSTLLFYKLEAAHVILHRQSMSMPALARDVLTTLQPLAEKREVTLTLNAGLNLPDCWIDVIQMKRVLHNLISNAISYGRRHTAIQINIHAIREDGLEERGEECLQLEVRNEGKGILPADLPRIFDKYYSVSRRFRQIGTGLGLYISKRIVEMHGGKIWVTSEPGQQTCFYISLPLAQHVDKSSSSQQKRAGAGNSVTMETRSPVSSKSQTG